MKIGKPKASQGLRGGLDATKQPQPANSFDALPQHLIEDVLIPAMDHADTRAAFAQTCWAAYRAHTHVTVLEKMRDLNSGLPKTPRASDGAQAVSAIPPRERFRAAQKRAAAAYALSNIRALFPADNVAAGAMGSRVGGQMGSIADALEAVGQAAVAVVDPWKAPGQKIPSPAVAHLQDDFDRLEAALTQSLDAWVVSETAAGGNVLLAKYRILEAVARKSSHLDLSDLGLRTLPPIADYLPLLRSFNCRGNFLSTFIEELKPLKKLRNVDLSYNTITIMPAEIDQLASLASLKLACNAIALIPAQLGNLKRLRHLDLSGNEIDHLPPQLGECKGLKILNVAHNAIATLPAEIGLLDRLKILNLSENFFTGLPLQVTVLRALESLDISNNPLTHVAAAIASMRSLRILNLDFTDVEDLPPEMGQLASLRFLSLKDTFIASFPAAFRELALEILRPPDSLIGLVFDDYEDMDSRIKMLTAILNRFMVNWAILPSLATVQREARSGALGDDAKRAVTRLDELTAGLSMAVQTDLASFKSRVTIIP
jgi:hypothetical protein